MGGSSGLVWNKPHEDRTQLPYIYGLILENTDAMEIRADLLAVSTG